MITRILMTTALVLVSSQLTFSKAAAQRQDLYPWAGVLLSERLAWDLPLPPRLEVMKQGTRSRPGFRKSIIQTPIQIRDKTNGHGLSTHATSEMIVRLPPPGPLFEAEMGIDGNSRTEGKLVPVIFVAEVRSKACGSLCNAFGWAGILSLPSRAASS